MPIVAQRIWRAWWEPHGEPLSDVQTALDEILLAEGFPFSLVATRDGRFAGTVTSIMTDIDERPALGPCLAALWVEPEDRGMGLGQLLMDAVVTRLAEQAFKEVYLSAKPHLVGFYDQRGWTLIERDLGHDRLNIFRRALP